MTAIEYFLAVGKIWRAYNSGAISMGEREKALFPYRQMLAAEKVVV